MCMMILRVLEDRLRERERGAWTYQTLAGWTGSDAADQTFQDSVHLMVAHPRVRALDMHLLYFNPLLPGDVGTPLSVEEERAALRRDGFFVDPQTGERVADYKSHLVPYFVPSEELEAAVRG